MIKVDTKSLQNAKIEPKEVLNITGKHSLEVGFFASATYPSGEYVAQVAYWQEYGTIRIPMRPFFRNAIEKNNKKWFNTFEALIKQNVNETQALAKVGEMARGDIIKSITQFREPANAPSTIKAKGSSNPLIDTGLMRRSVTYKVI